MNPEFIAHGALEIAADNVAGPSSLFGQSDLANHMKAGLVTTSPGAERPRPNFCVRDGSVVFDRRTLLEWAGLATGAAIAAGLLSNKAEGAGPDPHLDIDGLHVSDDVKNVLKSRPMNKLAQVAYAQNGSDDPQIFFPALVSNVPTLKALYDRAYAANSEITNSLFTAQNNSGGRSVLEIGPGHNFLATVTTLNWIHDAYPNQTVVAVGVDNERSSFEARMGVNPNWPKFPKMREQAWASGFAFESFQNYESVDPLLLLHLQRMMSPNAGSEQFILPWSIRHMHPDDGNIVILIPAIDDYLFTNQDKYNFTNQLHLPNLQSLNESRLAGIRKIVGDAKLKLDFFSMSTSQMADPTNKQMLLIQSMAGTIASNLFFPPTYEEFYSSIHEHWNEKLLSPVINKSNYQDIYNHHQNFIAVVTRPDDQSPEWEVAEGMSALFGTSVLAYYAIKRLMRKQKAGQVPIDEQELVRTR